MGDSLKKIEIEKYIGEYKEGRITVKNIAEEEGACVATINKRINEYYDKIGEERPEFRKGIGKKPYKINIKPYIGLLKKGEITKKAIAEIEGVSVSLITERIREYCTEKGKKKLNLRQWNGRKRKVDVAPYMKDLIERKMTKKEIAHKLKISIPTLNKKINEFNNKKESQNIMEEEKLLKNLLEDFLNKGLHKEKIQESALKRNIIIPDSYFKKFRGETSKGLDRGDD